METIFELLKLKHDYYTICKSFTIECVFKLERVIVILLETIRYVLLDLGPCLLSAMGIILVPMIFDFRLYFAIPFYILRTEVQLAGFRTLFKPYDIHHQGTVSKLNLKICFYC